MRAESGAIRLSPSMWFLVAGSCLGREVPMSRFSTLTFASRASFETKAIRSTSLYGILLIAVLGSMFVSADAEAVSIVNGRSIGR